MSVIRAQNGWMPRVIATICIALSFLSSILAQCPSDARWVYNNNNDRCYFPFPSVNTWTWCEQTCSNNGMSMLCINDFNQNDFVLSNFLSTSSYIPIGYKDVAMNSQYGWTAQNCFSSYTPWAFEEPSYSPNEYCVYTSSGGFTNRKCDNNGGSDTVCVCEVESVIATETEPQVPMDPGAVVNPCPNDWVHDPTSGECFYFDRTPDSWEWCNEFCAANGVGMPCVANLQQNDFLRGQLVVLDFDGLMLGYTDRSFQNSFAWDGSGGCTSSYTNWVQNGEPFSELYKNCAFMSGTGSGEWTTSTCGTLLNSADVCACQGNINSVPAVMNAVNAPEPRCPAGWEYIFAVDMCYYLDHSVTTWDWCEATCAENAVDMLIISNTQETDLLISLKQATFQSSFPLGLRWAVSTFAWTAFASNTYFGDFSEDNTNGDCVYLGASDTWEAAACASDVGATCVCQAAGGTAPATMTSIAEPVPPLVCPSGWSEYFSKCYYLEASMKTWLSCNSFCAANNVGMPCVENGDEDSFLASLKNAFGVSYFPLALSDLNHDGTFNWPAGCSSGYTSWGNSQPSHDPGEYCAYIWSGSDGWNDALCDMDFGATCVCESTPQNAPVTMSTANPCPAGWEYFANSAKCYFFDDIPRTWQQCSDICDANGVSLPCVESANENLFLSQVKDTKGFDGVNVGYSKADANSAFAGTVGCSSAFSNWDIGNPVSTADYYCTILDMDFAWSNHACDVKYQTGKTCACEATPATAPALMNRCPTSWEYFAADDKCYFFDPTPRTWDQCSAFCDANGVTLPCVETSDENNFLHTTRLSKGFDGVSVGYSKPTANDPFAWTAGCSSSYSAWDVSFPVSTTDFYCAVLKTDGADGEWANTPCGTQYETGNTCVCEASPVAAPAVMLEPATNPCPVGWEYFADTDTCFLFESTLPGFSWDSCHTFCRVNNASLPCVQSSAQNDFLAATRTAKGHATAQLPLGLRDITHNNIFEWSDACNSSYTNWNETFPRGGHERYCSMLRPESSGWANQNCTATDYPNGLMCVCEATPDTAIAVADMQMVAAPDYSGLCPAGWAYMPGDDTCVLMDDTQEYSWYTCQDFCEQNGLSMLCPRNAQKNSDIFAAVGTIATLASFPLAGRDISGSPDFAWNTGCDPLAVGFSSFSWAVGECIVASNNLAAWNTLPCDTPSPVLKCACEAVPAAVPPTIDPVVVESCPAGWHEYAPDDKCYYLPTFTMYSWDECRDFCDANGVDMICLEDSGQDYFVRRLGNEIPVAVGLREGTSWYQSPPSAGNYEWYAGCSSSGVPWMQFEPSGGGAHCGGLGPTGLTDVFCDLPEMSMLCGCESTPQLAPATMVGGLNAAIPSMLSSDTYVVRNGFAFAALANDSTVHTWGEEAHGGNSSEVQEFLQAGIVGIAHSRFAFVALAFDDTMYGWGDKSSIRDIPTSAGLVAVVGNEGAFAGHTFNNFGFAFGSVHGGGSIPPAYTDVLAGAMVQSLVASSAAFAALLSDNTVHAWGSPHTGGGANLNPVPYLYDVVKVVANREAFAALDKYGYVTTWGSALAGGNSSKVSRDLESQVVHIVGTRCAFAAFKADGSLVVWGYWKDGGDASAISASLSSGVVAVAHTYTAMAALKADGTGVTWGRETDGGDSSGVSLTNLVSIAGNSKAFAAITATGGVVAWGREAFGGTIPADKATALSSGVVSIYHTDRAFAALKANGALVVWGQAGHGGSPGSTVEALLTAGIHTVCANDAAFSAINVAGEVIAWGHPVVVPVPGVVYQSSSLLKSARCNAEVGGAFSVSLAQGADDGYGEHPSRA